MEQEAGRCWKETEAGLLYWACWERVGEWLSGMVVACRSVTMRGAQRDCLSVETRCWRCGRRRQKGRRQVYAEYKEVTFWL